MHVTCMLFNKEAVLSFKNFVGPTYNLLLHAHEQ